MFVQSDVMRTDVSNSRVIKMSQVIKISSWEITEGRASGQSSFQHRNGFRAFESARVNIPNQNILGKEFSVAGKGWSDGVDRRRGVRGSDAGEIGDLFDAIFKRNEEVGEGF